ncbi:MAG: metal ABC transporter ATP-binding protein [Lachnospiraceae bacterium]|nr:metal ABC transporter ATP-binding protein [Lachnospiraceae bacterium]
MKELLTCKNVSFGYENIIAISDVSFSLKEGEYLCVVGENGSGKSTLMKGLLGLLKPLKGELILEEALQKSSIGYLPQQTDLQKDFPATVFEVVLSGCLKQRGFLPFYSKKEKETAMKNLKRLGMEEFKFRPYKELSGGQQQRVLIARALCATDRLLILDEPVTGLDPAATMELYQLIKHLNQKYKVAIIMVTHDIKSAVNQADLVLHLGQTQLFFGNVEKYKQSEIGTSFLNLEQGGKQS